MKNIISKILKMIMMNINRIKNKNQTDQKKYKNSKHRKKENLNHV